MKNKIFIGEFIGSAFLVMVIVGSGIMAQNLTRDFAVMLLANTLATGAGLFVLISSIANISGAHFNPVVTMAMYFTKKIKKDLAARIQGGLLADGLSSLAALNKKIKNSLEPKKLSETLLVPFEFGDRKAWLYENGVIVNEFYTDDGFKFDVTWSDHQKAKYYSFAGL